MKFKYRVLSDSPYVERLEVSKDAPPETTALNGDYRQAEIAEDTYFGSFSEAKIALMAKARLRMGNARLEVNLAKGFLDNIKGLKEKDCK